MAVAVGTYNDFDTLNRGEEVEVYIIDVPINCDISNKNIKAYFRFEYDGKTYAKNIKGEKYCETIVPNSFITLKKNKDSSNFVYPDENIKFEIAASITLFIIGLGCFYKGLKNKTNY